MKRVTFPIRMNESGIKVSILHGALEYLGYKIPMQEVLRQLYGEGTKQQIHQLQKDYGLPQIDYVDERTAIQLNKLIADKDVIDELKGHSEHLKGIDDNVGNLASVGEKIEGNLATYRNDLAKLRNIDDKLGKLDSVDTKLGRLDGIDSKLGDHTGKLGGIDSKLGELNENVKQGAPLSIGSRGDDVKKLHNYLKSIGHHIPEREEKAKVFGVGTLNALLKFQAKCDLLSTGILDEATKSALNKALSLSETGKYYIEGRVFFENKTPAKNIKLRLYSRGFGGKEDRVDKEDDKFGTDDKGFFALPYDLGGRAPNLEIRMITDPKDPQKEITLCKTKFSVDRHEVLNLVIPSSAQTLETEYKRLTEDLKQHVSEPDKLDKLADAKEDYKQKDLTFLHQATGWDARLIAFAVITERLSADPEVKLPQEAVYGLLRAGLPSDKLQLAHVEPNVVDQALKKVRDAGIVGLTNDGIEHFKNQFTTFSNKMRLNIAAPGSRTTYGELLKASGLPDDTQVKFASVYLSHRGDAAQLWDKAREVGLGDAQIRKLQLQGKFAFLSGNSKGMTARLLTKTINGNPINNPVQLVEQDFHFAEAWVTEVFEEVGIPKGRWNNLNDGDREKLDEVIPTAYAAEKVEDRLHAYAEDMARKVRLSYPTQVVGRLIEKDEKFKPIAHPDTVTLLKNAAEQGFRLGETPVAAFLKTHTGIAAGATQTAQKQLQTVQRVYQITPSNEAMPVLMSLGMTSAYDVMAYSEAAFMALYAAKYFEIHKKEPAQAESRLIYRKAKQVSSVTYNLFTIAKKLDSEPSVAGLSAPVEVRESVRNELIKQFPTMESLFGSMDFCECEHCRSVLSPAAYLVDLLQFVDPEQAEWDNFLATWKKTHNDQEYPHKDASGKAMKPYDVLIERRPDICHIPLTCENTHTALPYIDIVNEILEYYVAHEKLSKDAAHDTGEATTEELLAEPQNVIREAYDRLRDARYPLNLPFDFWIETVRQFCNYFETPLDRVLETFRAGDDLFAPTQSFDRAGVFMESLGLSSAEVAIFIDPEPLKLGKWHELFGYPRGEIGNPGNIANAIVNIPNPIADLFSVGDKCTYYDAGTGDLGNDENEISAIGTKDSGGQGKVKITFVSTWTTPPKNGDILVLAKVLDLLKSAKSLSRRLGVTYKEIAEIVNTRFVNPKLTKLALLYKLGVAIQDARFYVDHKGLLGQDPSTLSSEDQKRQLEVEAFAQELGGLAETFQMTSAELEAEVLAIPFDEILVLADPDTGCSFDLTTLRYADGVKKADPIAFLRINLFVRLWRKLGWSIEETDRALSTCIPQSAPFDRNPLNLANQPLKTALIYLAHLKRLDEELKVGKQSRLKLLAFWSDISTTGKKPLYAQLFLTRSVLKTDTVFDNPLGDYLSTFSVDQKSVEPGDKLDENIFAGQPNVSVSYDPQTKIQRLSYKGFLTEAEKALIKALVPGSQMLASLLDRVQASSRISGHMLALQGALGLTADEISRILEDEGKSFDSAELSLLNVSLLYRYGLLAKALKLSVRELITLKQLSSIDPFKSLHPDPLKTLDEDYPFTQTQRFVEIAEKVKDSGLKIEDLDYLLRHRFDETGKYRPNPEGTLALLKTLAEGVRAIRTEHAMPDDPGALSEEVLRQKLGLALTPDVVERFLSMMNGTAEFTASKTGVDKADELRPTTFADDERIRNLNYKEVPHKEQKLTFRGVLFDAQKTELQARFDAVLTAQQKPVFAELLGGVQALAIDFFENQLKKQKLRVDGEAGFLEDSDFEALFLPLKPLKKILPTDTPQDIDDKLKENEDIEQENQATLQQRRYRVAKAFLPYVQQRLIRQLIVQTMTAHMGAEPVLVESLVTDERLLAVAGSKPLLASFAATGERGVDAAFFDSDNLSGTAQATKSVVHSADTVLKDTQDSDGNLLNPANSARFEGYLEVPTPGAYRFYIELEKENAEVELRFDHLPDPVFLKGRADVDNAVLDEYLELKPGLPYCFTLELKKLGGGGARLLVQGETLPKDGVSQLTLYPLSAMSGAERAILLLTKALQIIQSLELSEREVRYLLTDGVHAFDNLEFNTLPWRDAQHELDTITRSKMQADNNLTKGQAMSQARNENPDIAGEADLVTPHFEQLLRLADYVRLKRDLAAGTDDLIDTLEANGAGDLNKVYPLIAKLTRRDEATVKATANGLVGAPAAPSFESEKPLVRLWEALQVVERFGVSVASLLAWTRIISKGVTPEQRFEIARDLKESIKARFEPETWQGVAQPIFDKLRQRQCDALVTHVMHQHGFARMEQLYEYFLIDPGMEPVVQTSRIRLAIASLQLFVHRCLLNLEPKVHPSTINSRHWEWMKRYRVWEANRKIFLFPENWLEPEFRDDKTHLFAELEGALLQGDVSIDLVEDAFLNYLKKLDELARLDIVAMHIEDNPDPARRILHVFGRTFSLPRKYFYRRYAHQMWTPWEPVTAEIEGDHLVPVVWRDRLYLFWVTFLEKAHEENEDTTIDPTQSITIRAVKRNVEVQLHWSEYLQGEWSTRESSGFDTPSPIVKTGLSNFDSKSVFVHVSKAYEAGEESGVYINLGGAINQAFYLAGSNSEPEKKPYIPKPTNPYSANVERATRHSGTDALTVTFKQRIRSGRVANHIPLYRLWSRKAGDHFYTTSEQEHDRAIEKYGYKSEGVACHVLPVKDKAGIPLYRLWNSTKGDHFYTTSEQEHDRAIEKYGYKSEGVACHVLPVRDKAGIPLYRLWNSTKGNHFYTTSEKERDKAIADYGYISEDVACAVVFYEELTVTQEILQRDGDYALVPCDKNLTALGVSKEAYQYATKPKAVSTAIECALGEIASLMKPVFYQDNANTLFVEPNVTERTLEEWQEWVTSTLQPEPGWVIPDWWERLVVIPKTPWKEPIPDPIDPGSLISPKPGYDWIVNPATVLVFDKVLIGPAGQTGLQILSAGAPEAIALEDTLVGVNPGSSLPSGITVVVEETTKLEQNGLIQAASGLNVIGSAGLNATLEKNFNALNRKGFSAGVPGAQSISR